MLKIALPNKGRLADETRELFDDAGLDVRARGDRALTASLGGAFEGLFVRAQDIPEFVADGAADAGVTGWDLVCESQRALDPLIDLEFGRCRLVLAAREGAGVESLEQTRSHLRHDSALRANVPMDDALVHAAAGLQRSKLSCGCFPICRGGVMGRRA